ncbi:glucosaminidase domain-containing protein [Catellatospora sichuanensis]|uniref:glucosaminidase domain-containing protein n=1 Tax=Catellatospora sichuanensis TaxID=1969805 RepID=UPI0016434BAD|nr:glucosaminidase domain-containing protein [Catellatospora sichuanensis]
MSATPRTVLRTALIAPFLLFTAFPAPLAAAAPPPVVPAGAVSAVPGALLAVADPTAPSARINTDGGVVSVRSGPATDKRAMASLGDDTRVAVHCKVWGEQVAGTERRSAHWMRVGADRYLPDAFLAWPTPRPEVPWCGSGGTGPVTARVATGGSVLNLRRDPGTRSARLGTVDDGQLLAVLCQATGQQAAGSAGWLRLPGGRYVAEAFVRWSPQRPWLPWCGQEPVRVPPVSSRDFVEQATVAARAAAQTSGVPASVLVAQAVQASDWGRATAARRDHNYFDTACTQPAVDPPPAASPDSPPAASPEATPAAPPAAASPQSSGGPQGAVNPRADAEVKPIALGCRGYGGTSLRAYRDQAGSFADQAALLARAPQHARALAHAGDPERFVRELQAAGYPGGARYADRIVELMRRYDLYRLDAVR